MSFISSLTSCLVMRMRLRNWYFWNGTSITAISARLNAIQTADLAIISPAAQRAGSRDMRPMATSVSVLAAMEAHKTAVTSTNLRMALPSSTIACMPNMRLKPCTGSSLDALGATALKEKK